MTQISNKPSELVIFLSLRNILWPLLFSSPILVILFVNRFSANALAHDLDAGEIFFGGLIIVGALVYLVDFIIRGKSRRYLVIGEKGIFVGGVKPRMIWWRQVKDCDSESSNKRKVLKIRTQGRLQGDAPSAAFSVAHVFGAAKWRNAEDGQVDIDFARTETPQRSLELAVQSCRAWLASMRDSESPT